jgi:glyoxylase I family protein
MQLSQFLHAAIVVSDLEQAEHFYGTVLGLSKVDRVLKFPGAWYEIGNFQIHLIAAETVPLDIYNAEKWGRNRHLAFSVISLEDAKKDLTKNNYQFQTSASGRSALFVKDPDGNIIELGEV